MVRFDVEFEMLLQRERAEKRDPARDVEIILMLRRPLRFRLNQELAFDTDRFRMVEGPVENRGQVVLLAFQLRVEKRFVSFTAAPENIVFPAELFRDLE